MEIKKGDVIYITKIKDKVFNGYHPNGVYEGTTFGGIVDEDLTIGEQLTFNGVTAWTSKVDSYNPETLLIETKNSIYKVNDNNRNKESVSE